MNKQIEEIDKIIEADCDIPCHECKYQDKDGTDGAICIPLLAAERLYNAGYRKASDVARKIFEEIDKRFEALLKFYPCNGEFEDAKKFVDFHWKHIRHSIMCDYDAAIKKKNESEGAEDENCV